MSDDTKRRAAEMLLVGYVRAWSMGQVLANIIPKGEIGLQDIEGLHAAAPFMPPVFWAYKRTARELVALNWPKLNEWLLKHEGDPAKVLSVADQVARLKWKPKHGDYRTAEDKREAKQVRDMNRQAATSYALSRKLFKTNQRSAWNVCKG